MYSLGFFVLLIGSWSLGVTVVLDYNPTKAHSHTTGMTHLLDLIRSLNYSKFESQKPFETKSLIVLFNVLLLCKRVLYYCHRVSTQL